MTLPLAHQPYEKAHPITHQAYKLCWLRLYPSFFPLAWLIYLAADAVITEINPMINVVVNSTFISNTSFKIYV